MSVESTGSARASVECARCGVHDLFRQQIPVRPDGASRPNHGHRLGPSSLQLHTPRQGDLDGRGNLSLRALQEFVLWFLKVCLDQVTFMSSLFDLNNLSQRMTSYVQRNPRLKPQAAGLLQEALVRGEFERGEIERITGLPERSARRVLNDVIELGLLGSETPKGKVSLRFPADALEDLFPRLYLQT